MRSPTKMLDEQIQACARCPLASEACNITHGKMLGFGYAGQYMIVGMNPSTRRSERDGYAMAPPRPLDNTSEGLLWRVLAEIKWPVSHTYWTNLVKCSTEGNGEIEMANAWTCINEYFEREFMTVNPDHIVCLGKWVYDVVSNAGFRPKGRVHRVFHHAYIARTPTKYNDWRKQWARILRVGQ